MSATIAVIDYGMGNLRSVAKAIEHVSDVHDQVIVTHNAEKIAQASHIVFPGQGAARDCMAAIQQYDLLEVILKAAKEKPFLGICMGLQVLLDFSEENDGTDLLGLYEGNVTRFKESFADDGSRLKIPHMGWSQVEHQSEHPLWKGIEQYSRFYFVHSYHINPTDKTLVEGVTTYGETYASAIAHDNLFATQFHPEKSADTGLQLLNNFVNWQP